MFLLWNKLPTARKLYVPTAVKLCLTLIQLYTLTVIQLWLTQQNAVHIWVTVCLTWHGDIAGSAAAEGADEHLPWYRTAMMWICGIEKHEEPVMTEEERKAFEAKQISLDEDPYWKKIVNINALTLMVVATFIWGFFY